MSQKDSLSHNQIRTIAALLSEKTIEGAARSVGINPRTVYRWMDSSDFRSALIDAEGDAIDAAVRRLIGGGDSALDTLAELMKTAMSESVRKLAASDWLDHLLKLRDLRNVEKRLSALEAAINGENN